MYCAEWDLLFILGGRKLQLFEIVRHDCRRLAEKMRHTRMNAVPHSIVWFFFFSWQNPPYLLPIHQPYPLHCHPAWNSTLEVLAGEHEFCSQASCPSCPSPGWPLLGLQGTCCSHHSWGSSSFNKSLSSPHWVPRSALGGGGTMVNVTQSMLPQTKRSVKYGVGGATVGAS